MEIQNDRRAERNRTENIRLGNQALACPGIYMFNKYENILN